MIRKSVYYFVLLISVFLIFPNIVSSHPLDELGNVKLYDQKQVLTLTERSVKLRIEMRFFAYEKTVVWEGIDLNKDRIISAAEKNNWMQLGKNSSWLVFNGKKYFFAPSQLTVPDYYTFFSPQPVNISLEYSNIIPIGMDSIFEYHYRGKDKKLNEIDLKIKRSGYPDNLTFDRSGNDAVRINLGATGKDKSNSVPENSGNRLRAFLAKYIKTTEELPLALKLWAVAVAFSLGALHALTPGHGKAIAAGYLIGERGTVLHALNLGLIITVTHTSSVFLLGLGALLLTQYVVPDVVIRWLNFFSGLIIFAFGLYLIFIRGRKLIQKLKSAHSAESHLHNHTHQHSGLSFKSLLTLGISGGIVPCVDALAILIVAVSLNKIIFGILLLLSFSLGLAAVLVASGIMVVIAKNKAVKKFAHLREIEPYLSLFSALIVTVFGLVLFLPLLLQFLK